jgi:hypothetical protein
MVRTDFDAIAPFSEEGGCVNFMADDDQGRIKANYKGTTTGSSTSSGRTTRATSSI